MALIMTQHTDVSLPAGPTRPAGKPCGLRWLLFWFFLIWSFVFVLAPWLQRSIPVLQQVADYVRASGINASAMYYTGVDETSESGRAIRNTFHFTPDSKKENTTK